MRRGPRSPHYAVQALATQAYLGRRKDMFRTELIYALKMLQDGVRTRETMNASWAEIAPLRRPGAGHPGLSGAAQGHVPHRVDLRPQDAAGRRAHARDHECVVGRDRPTTPSRRWPPRPIWGGARTCSAPS